VELFHSPICGNAFSVPVGEGKLYLGAVEVSTDGSGNGGFTLATGQNLSAGLVTGTATDGAGNTSEFSYCKNITGSAIPGKPALLKPSNNGSVEQNPVLLTWQPAPNATFYKVFVRLGPSSGPLFHKNKNVMATEYQTPSLQSGVSYSWRVAACNATSPKCTKSQWFSFHVP
jgi:hypothetical protein